MKDAYDDLRALYRAARRQEEPSRSDRRAVRAALLGVGATSVAVHASAVGAKAIAVGTAKLFTVGQFVGLVSVGVALGTGVAVIGTVASSKRVIEPPAVTVPKQQNPQNAARLSQVAKPTPVPGPESSVPSDIGGSAPSPASLTTSNQQPATSTKLALPTSNGQQPAIGQLPSAPSNQRPTMLAAESRGLVAVQSALTAQNPVLALQLLSAQENEFGSGALGQERAAARVIALCSAGRIADAVAARERFLAAYPNSPLARRVGGVCAK